MRKQPAEDRLDDAYERVTDPERYRVLHAAARELIDRLCTEHRPQRVDAVDLDPECARYCPGAPATSLVPSRGAPLTFTFTPFPGVMVRYGFGGTAMFPACGCDACDDDPRAEAARMAALVRDMMSGSFSETRRRRFLRSDSYESELRTDGVAISGGWRSVAPAVVDTMPVGTTRWPPWTPSTPAHVDEGSHRHDR